MPTQTLTRRATFNRQRAEYAPARSAPATPRRSLPPPLEMTYALQRTAGNQAVARMVAGWRDGSIQVGSLPTGALHGERQPSPGSGAQGPALPVRVSRSAQAGRSGRPVVQRQWQGWAADLVLGFTKTASQKGVGSLGAYLAGPFIEQAQRLAAPLAKDAVDSFLRTPEGKRGLYVAVLAKIGREGSGDASKALAPGLERLLAGGYELAKAKLIEPLRARLPEIPDMTPQKLSDAMAYLDRVVNEAKQNAVVKEAQQLAATMAERVAPIASALAEGIKAFGVKWGIEKAIDTFLDGKAVLAQAIEHGKRAATGTVLYDKLADALARATTFQDTMTSRIEWVEGKVEAAMAYVPDIVPDKVKEIGARTVEKAQQYVPSGARDAVEKIKPGLPGATKRTGSYAAEKLLGEGDALGAAKDELKKVADKGATAAKQRVEEAVDESASSMPSVGTMLKGGQLMHALANAEKGKEVEAAGETGASMALTAGGTAFGAMAGTAATAVLPAVLAPALPFILGAAGAHLAAQSDAGQRLTKAGGEITRELTHIPILGMPLQKGTEALATLSAVLGWGIQSIRPRKIFGGSDEAVAASRQNIADKAGALMSGWSASNLFRGVDVDVINIMSQRITAKTAFGPTVAVDVADVPRANIHLAKKAMLDVYFRARAAGVLAAIAEITVTGKGFEATMTPDNVPWEAVDRMSDDKDRD